MKPSCSFAFAEATGLSFFRRTLSRSWSTLILLLATVAGASAAEPAPLIPVETFFRLPAIAQVKLSPEGDYVAYLAPYERRQNLFVRRIGDPEAIRLTSSTVKDLGGFFWIGNERLAYTIDEGGKENWHIRVIGRDGAGGRALTPETGVRAALVAQLDDTHLLIKLNQRDPRVQDLHKIDVNTGASELVVKNDRNYVGYFTDNSGVVRLAMATDGVNFALFHRGANEAPFERVLTTDFRATVVPLFFTRNNRYVYALSNRNRDKAAVVLLDPHDGRELEVIYQHAEYDAAGLIRDERKEKIVGAHYVGEKPERVYFDEHARDREFTLRRLLPGKALEFASNNRAGTDFIIKAWSDGDPGTFYRYHEPRQELTQLGAVTPWIDPSQLATITPVSYRARDGLTIHGYLTRPRGATGPTPTLLMVHGGPWARDQWRADPEVQFFANRGYTVLQVNFRGSTGYGRAFFEAGFKQWGRAMQDDITDGLRWLVEQKVADPDRVGIYGISYGGYATLAGLAFTPELYRCGIDDSGLSDLGDWLSALPPQAQNVRAMYYAMVGDPQADR
jgi:dipeptidyl aminopeptidase/acylaminoacyl peptidase